LFIRASLEAGGVEATSTKEEHRMRIHGNAALCLNQRRRLVRRVFEEGWSLAEAAKAAEVSERTAGKWVARYRAEGELGLLDRSSAPKRIPHRTPEDRIAAIASLRRLRFSGPQLAELLSMPRSTVSAVLTRIGMGRLGRLGLEPARRYEKQRPGELIHVDVKKLGRIQVPGKRMRDRREGRAKRTRANNPARRYLGTAGWEFVHIAIDDATRLAYAEVLPDERATTAVGFLGRALAFYRGHGIGVEAVMTDNGSCYRSTMHAVACKALGLKHRRTRPYRPQTNGKAERFIRTMLGGWAYAALYRDSADRTAALSGWLSYYNFSRRHGSLGHRPPGARLAELNNLAGSYS
jgi:transposase InsO family protein